MNEMLGLRGAIEKIEEMAIKGNIKLFDIHDRKYSTKQLYEIEKRYDAPQKITLNTLESLTDVIKIELNKIPQPLFIDVVSPIMIEVFTTFLIEESCRRNFLYKAEAELPHIDLNTYINHESFMISLRSKFVENDDVKYMLELLSKISDKNSVESEDNGMSQTVQARKGVVLVENVTVRPKVKLAPFRTFLEIDQPESEFLLRLREGGQIGIYEADGGAWKLDAKSRIKKYLLKLLENEVKEGQVVIIA